MVRKGIYVNGKEIVARYVGDKLVWKRQVSKRIVNIISTSYITKSRYLKRVTIYGTFTNLHQATFENVTLVINGVTFPYLIDRVELQGSNPIATIYFIKSDASFDLLNRMLETFRSYEIQMFIKE